MKQSLLKIDFFNKDIISDVSEKKAKMESDIDKELKADYESKELEYLEEAYNTIQDGLKNIDREKNEVISKTLMENKIKLLSKRNAIVKNVFETAKERILAYTKTEEYKQGLLERIRKHLEYLGPGEHVIYLNYEDKMLYNFVHDEFNDCKVMIEKRQIEMLGGCKVYNQTTNIYIDDSYAKRLDEEAENFLQYCGIEINDKVGD